MSGVLAGIKVLEFGQYIAGPYAATLLAEQGAKVVKVEQPGGDPYRPEGGFSVCNRSKESIVLDLKTPEGRQVAQRLAKEADVVIENYRPGVAEKLGIGYDTLKELNPRLIYCSISGFGRSGKYKEVPGWEPLVLSMSTVYTGQGRVGDPIYQNLQVASHYAGVLAAYYIVMAVYAREISGKGERIDLSLLKSVVAMQPNILGNSPLKFFLPFTVRGIMPLIRIYQGSDGLWFVMNASSVPFFTSMCIALGREEWLVDPMFEGAPYYIMPPRNAQVAALLQELFYTKTRDEWVSILQKALVPAAPVLSIEQFMQHPHMTAGDFLVDMDDTRFGKVRQSNIPLHLSSSPGKIKGPAPGLGQHTDDVLYDIGYTAAEIKSLKRSEAI